MTDAPDIEALANRLTAAMPRFDPVEQRVALTLLRQLALGKAVTVSEVASAAELPEKQASAVVDRLDGFFRDEQRVIGFMGLSVEEMGRHRLHIDGRTLSAWCAWDTLFLPELLGEGDMEVTSRSPASDAAIELTVTATGPTDLQPPEAVVSMLLPDGEFGADVMQRFCHFVHFFASPQDSERWMAEHPDTFVLSVEDAYRLGQLTNHAVFGDALAPTSRQ